jgi:hypothetical protein
MMGFALILTNTLIWIFIVLAHWNNSPRVDMSLHSDTLFWFRANQSLLFLLNAACLAEKQQIPILKSLVWPDRDSNPRSTTFDASTLTIPSPMRFYERTWSRLFQKRAVYTELDIYVFKYKQ